MKKEVKIPKDYDAIIADSPETDEKINLMCNLKAMRIIRFALIPDTFRLVSTCDTAKGIWNIIKELY